MGNKRRSTRFGTYRVGGCDGERWARSCRTHERINVPNTQGEVVYAMRDIKELPEVMTAGEVATYLRVSKTTICRWCSSGVLPAFRIGRGWRIRRSDLEDYIKTELSSGEQKKDIDQHPFKQNH